MNVDKFKLFEKIKLSYLKHRGNVLFVARELNLDVDYVRTIVRKFKKQEERDVAVLISHTLMQQILLGRESRIAYLQEALQALENRHQMQVSICCEAPVRCEEISGASHLFCLKCQKVCDVKIVDEHAVYDMRMNLLRELREEDDRLVDWADKMGYTNKPILPPPMPGPTQNIKQNILVVDGKGLTEDGKRLLIEASQLPPMAVTKLIKDIEQRVLGEDVKEAPEPEQEEKKE
jgi:hypothetical protein